MSKEEIIKNIVKKKVEKRNKPNKKVLRVTFEYIECSDTKSLKIDYGGDYTPEECETLLTYVIDSILSTSYSKRITDAWNDYKYAMERGK